MKLAIDIREACSERPAGKGRWTRGFLMELLSRGEPLILYSDKQLPGDIAKAASGCDVRVIHKKGIMWHLAVARDVMHDSSIDAYVSTVSYIVPVLLRGCKPCVVVVHDLIAFRSEPHDRRASFIEHVTAQIALRHASLICTVSDATARDIRSRFPSLSTPIVPVYAGCDVPLSSRQSPGDGCVLCIGTLCPRKNQLHLIRAHQRLSHDLRVAHPLILVGGRGWNDDEIVQAAGSDPHVQWRGYVSDAERAVLLADAAVFAFPSLYEGFGLPVLEAFASGVPVLTSGAGSLEEIARDAAVTVDPFDVDSIRSGLEHMLTDPGIRSSCAEKGLKRARDFSWQRTVDLFKDAIRCAH